MEDISQKGINNVENVASHTANDVGTAPVIGLVTVSEVEEGIKKLEIDDDKVHGVQDTVGGVRNGTRNVDNKQGIIEDIGARVIDGDEKIIRPIASDWALSSLCIDGYIGQMFSPQVAQEYHTSLRRGLGQIQLQADVAGTDAFLATPSPGQTSGQHDWIIDYAVVDRGPVIRQKIWTPRKSSDKMRWVDHNQLQPPIFFVHKNGQDLGLPLIDTAKGNCMCLQGAEEAVPVGSGAHVQIRINWCGYVYLDWSDQISIQKQTQPRETISLETFAKHVAKKTLKFMEIAKNNDNDNDQPERYPIGDEHIVPRDVILIGTVQVSHGSWMPILQLNTGYAQCLGI